MPTTPQIEVCPADAYPAPAACKFFYRGVQTDGDVRNAIPGKTVASKQVGFLDNVCWATPGYATIGGGGQNYCTIAAATADLESLATHALVLTMRLKKVAVAKPAAEGMFYASYQPGQAPYGGIILSMLTTGAIRLYINATDNTSMNFSTAADVLTNGAAAPEINLVFIVDGALGYNAVNGVEAASTSTAAVATKAINSGRNARLGLSLPGTNQPDACGIASFGAYCVDRSRGSINRQAVYDWALRNPDRPLPDSVFGL